MISQEATPSVNKSKVSIESSAVPATPIQEFEDAVRNMWYPNALKYGCATEDNGRVTINAFEMDYSSSVRGRVNSKVVGEIEVVDDPGQTSVTIKNRTRGYMYVADKSKQEVRFYTKEAVAKKWERTSWKEDTERSADYNAESMMYWLIGPGSYEYVFLLNKADKLAIKGQSVKITG